MPSVSYNEQCFLLDGRPFWVVGASMQYARMDPSAWADRIVAARQAGFNCIETACPWMIHEPRPGRYEFSGRAAVRAFVEQCDEAGMKVILRLGPAVGAAFDGSGIPGWLMVKPEVRLREADPEFLGHYSRFLRKLLGELEGMSAPDGGPIILVQSEHAWNCSNPDLLDKYHRELARYVREIGFALPVLNANDLWQEPAGTIDTWRGWDDLLVHLRQLRTIQPEAPRIVSTLAVGRELCWGDAANDDRAPEMLLERMCQTLAAGAQFVLSPFHAGTNFDFIGGRLSGRSDGFVTTTAAIGAPLSEAGRRTGKYLAAKRVAMFASQFAHVFGELNADFHPIVLDPAQIGHAGDGKGGMVSIVPQRGANGRAVFVFGGGQTRHTTLLLDNGLRMTVHLGEQPVAWFVFDVDLRGTARLDYVNLCPWALVDRSILVLFGPEGSTAQLSINDSPLEAVVPGGDSPLVLSHKGVTLVIVNQRQIDSAYHDEKFVYIGVDGFDAEGHPIAGESGKAWKIGADAQVTELKPPAGGPPASKRTARSVRLADWTASSTQVQSTGRSPRFASLHGPETLSTCGASTGYGWYRVVVNSRSTRKRLCHLPQSGDRLHLFLNGEPLGVYGAGPGSSNSPFEIKLANGENTLVALADNFGRFAGGNDMGRSKGLYGHLQEIKAVRAAKPKVVAAAPVDPFTLRGFIAGSAKGIPSDLKQAEWTFSHLRKTPILIDVNGARCSGTFVLNDTPIAYYAGATGACFARILVSQDGTDVFKRGRNRLRFAPDHDQHEPLEDIKARTTIYECIEAVTEGAAWSFEKWEAPMPTTFDPVAKAGAKSLRGAPCWWRTRFMLPSGRHAALAAWFDTAGLSKGQAYLNGHNLGRYFTATAGGAAVGPQTKLYIPEPWLKSDQANELLLFDEHGFDPWETKIVFAADGDF